MFGLLVGKDRPCEQINTLSLGFTVITRVVVGFHRYPICIVSVVINMEIIVCLSHLLTYVSYFSRLGKLTDVSKLSCAQARSRPWPAATCSPSVPSCWRSSPTAPTSSPLSSARPSVRGHAAHSLWGRMWVRRIGGRGNIRNRERITVEEQAALY